MAMNIIEAASIGAVLIAATVAAVIIPLKKEAPKTEEVAKVESATPATAGSAETDEKAQIEQKVQEIERDVSEARRDLEEIKAALRERAKKDERTRQP
jgi:hypothetical protein